MKRSIETTDIVLAAYLKIKGYPLDSIEKIGSRGHFVFSEVSDEDMATFDLGKGAVEPVTFNNTIKSLVTAIRRII